MENRLCQLYASHFRGDTPAFVDKGKACCICNCTRTTSNDKSITFLIICYIFETYFKVFAFSLIGLIVHMFRVLRQACPYL